MCGQQKIYLYKQVSTWLMWTVFMCLYICLPYACKRPLWLFSFNIKNVRNLSWNFNWTKLNIVQTFCRHLIKLRMLYQHLIGSCQQLLQLAGTVAAVPANATFCAVTISVNQSETPYLLKSAFDWLPPTVTVIGWNGCYSFWMYEH